MEIKMNINNINNQTPENNINPIPIPTNNNTNNNTAMTSPTSDPAKLSTYEFIQSRMDADEAKNFVEFEKKQPMILKLAATYIEKLGWPEAYDDMSIKDAIFLQMLLILNEFNENKLLSSNEMRSRMLNLIIRLHSRPFSEKNKQSFDHFIKSTNGLINDNTKNGLKCLSFLASQTGLNHCTVGQVKAKNISNSNLPIAKPLPLYSITNDDGIITIQPTQAFVKLVLMFTDEALDTLLKPKFIEEIGHIIQFVNVNSNQSESLLKKLHLLQHTYKARQKIIQGLIQNQNHFQSLNGLNNDDSISFIYQLKTLSQNSRLLGNQIENIRKCIDEVLEEINIFLDPSAIKSIKEQVEACYLMDEETSNDKDIQKNRDLSYMYNQFNEGMNSFEKLLVESCDQKSAAEIINLSKDLFTNPEEKPDLSTLISKVFNLISINNQTPESMAELLEKQSKRIKQQNLAIQNAHEMSAKVRNTCVELNEQTQNETLHLSKRNLFLKTAKNKKNLKKYSVLAKAHYQTFYEINYKLKMAFEGIRALRDYIELNHSSWLKQLHQKKSGVSEIDLDYWTQFTEEVMHQQPKGKTIKDYVDSQLEEKSKQVERPKKINSNTSSSVSSTAIIKNDSHAAYSQRIADQLISTWSERNKLKDVIGYQMVKDTAHHLNLIGANLDLLHTFTESEQLTFKEALIFRLVRHSSTQTEQMLALSLLESKGEITTSHSHCTITSSLSEKTLSGKFSQLSQLVMEYGTVAHRYPYSTQAMFIHQKNDLPLALKWLLKPTDCQLSVVGQWAEQALHWAECEAAGKISKLNKIITSQKDDSKPSLLSDNTFILKMKTFIGAIEEIKKQTLIMRARYPSSNILAKQMELTWQEINYHLIGLEQDLMLLLNYPQTRYLAAHGDSILTHLQFIDEQIETALHAYENGEFYHMHDLESYRALRNDTMDNKQCKVVQALNINMGGHYPHKMSYFLQSQNKASPLAITWRLDALQVSSHGDDIDAGMTPIYSGTKSKMLHPVKLWNALAEILEGELEMISDRLRPSFLLSRT